MSVLIVITKARSKALALTKNRAKAQLQKKKN